MKSKTALHPTIFVIFGGTGDLNKRKLAPALYNLFIEGYMPEKFAVIGTGRTEFTDDSYKAALEDAVNEFSRTGKVKKEKWEDFSKTMNYCPTDFAQPK
ncbi:MAG: glucose-6-phosphate dehydrogenase, partial [Pedobacter sp.]